MVKSISGMIKNFMDGGMMIDAAWLVELNKIQGDGPENTSISATFTGGTTTGGGTWSGTFYGAVDDDSDDVTPGLASPRFRLELPACSTPGSTTAT